MAEKVLGVDFGSGGIKLAELHRSKDSVTVARQGFVPLPAGLVAGGTPDHDRLEEVAQELKAYLALEKFTAREAVMGVNGADGVFASRCRVPWHSKADLHQALGYDLKATPALLTGAPEGVILDMVVFGEHEEEAENGEVKKTLDGLLCGVAPVLVADQMHILKKAGLTVVGADLNALALLRATRIQARPEGILDILVDVGSDVLSIVVHENGRPYAITLVPDRAGANATKQVGEALEDDDFENAERLKASNSADHRVQSALADGRFAIAKAMEEVLLGYAQQRGVRPRFASITLAGAGSLLPRLDEELSQHFRIPATQAIYDDAVSGDGLMDYWNGTLTDADLRSAVGLGLGVLN